MRHGAQTTTPRGGDQIKLGPEPQSFALKFTTGKDVESRFPGGRVMFSAVDGRKIFLNDEEANDLEHALVDQRIEAGQQIAVSRVQHGRGGGFAIRVEPAGRESRVDEFERTPNTEEMLERSVRIAKVDPSAFRQNRHIKAVQPDPSGPLPAPPAHAKGAMGNLLAGSLIASIDAYLKAAEYAKAQGIPVSLQLDFNGEDIRSSASVMQIEYYRSGGSRA